MRIGIDVSQLVYENTGVANYLKNTLDYLVTNDLENEYVLFGSSLRQKAALQKLLQKYATQKNVSTKLYSFPPAALDVLWNMLHVAPIEWFVGKVDIFLSSDWTQPPSRAKKATILYDLIIYTYPQEMDKGIVAVHKRRLKWVRKEVDKILCISEATKKDAMQILQIPAERLEVVYPGL